jgi:hypothetical protein
MTAKHFFLLWLPMIVIAFANTTLRELVFIEKYSEFRAHQLSTPCVSAVEHSKFQTRLFDWLCLGAVDGCV